MRRIAIACLCAGLAACAGSSELTGPSASVAPSSTVSEVLRPSAVAVVPVFVAGPNSCPHGAPAGLRWEGGAASGEFYWRVAPSIHFYQLSVERRGMRASWGVVEGFPRTVQDATVLSWGFRSGGSYRAFIRVRTECGDYGEWSPEYKFSLNELDGGGSNVIPGGTPDGGGPNLGPGNPGGGPVDDGGGPTDDGGRGGGHAGGCPNGAGGDHNRDGHHDCGVAGYHGLNIVWSE